MHIFSLSVIATNSTMCLECALVLSQDSYQQKDHNTCFTHKQFKEPFQCAHKLENLHFHDSIRLTESAERTHELRIKHTHELQIS